MAPSQQKPRPRKPPQKPSSRKRRVQKAKKRPAKKARQQLPMRGGQEAFMIAAGLAAILVLVLGFTSGLISLPKGSDLDSAVPSGPPSGVPGLPERSGHPAELPEAIPEPWNSLISETAAYYPNVDPRLVASVLWAENRCWPDINTKWRPSPVGAAGPWQFIQSSWKTMGRDGDKDGRADRNNPKDAVHGAFNHHANSAGYPIAGTGFDPNAGADDNFKTVVFERPSNTLLYFAAKYNGSGAKNGRALRDFPHNENSDYVIMNYWLLASNFEVGWMPPSRGSPAYFVNARTRERL